jgi:hypothetical protein
VWDSLKGKRWLYRGVPARSEQAKTARAYGEVCPPRLGMTGQDVGYEHTVGGLTDTGYTSWSTERWIAEEFGREATEDADAEAKRSYHDEGDEEDDAEWRDKVVILRVLIEDVEAQMEPGEEREDEWRLRGCVEGVEVCEGDDDDED